MTDVGFAHWDLSVWNHHLFNTVFGVKDGLLPVRRITVTPAFFARLAGLPTVEGERVRGALLTCLRNRFPNGRGLFELDPEYLGWNREAEIPPFFVNLYLSLIAASASEETHAQGNFRKRAAHLLRLPECANPVTYGLPQMWQTLAAWTQSEPALKRGYRPLELPNPRNENIIGYSKLLAFPRYLDMRWLSRAITQSAVGVDSPLNTVLEAVGRARHHFSKAFTDEFDRFKAQARTGDPACTKTLFWDVFCEVTWESHGGHRAASTCYLGMELPDLWRPQAALLIPRGLKPAQPVGRSFPLGAQSRHDRALISEDGWRLLGQRDHPWRSLLPNSLAALIEIGCIPFKPGDEIHWEACSTLPWGGPVWMIVSQARQASVRCAVTQVTEVGLTTLPDAAGWFLLGPLDYDRNSVPELLENMPYDLRSLLHPGVPDARITLRDCIRLPDGILSLKPRLPRVRAAGAEGVTLNPVDGPVSTQTDLELGSDGLFVIPPAGSPSVPQGDYRLTAHSNGRVQTYRMLHLLDTYNGDHLPLGPSDPESWLVEGSTGQLVSLTGAAPNHTEVLSPKVLPSLRAHLPIAPGTPPVRWLPLSEFPARWADLLEVLVAWSSRREGFGWAEVVSLVQEGLDLDERSTDQVLDTLVDNALLDRFYRRRWKGSLYFPCKPTCRFIRVGSRWEWRVTGATTRMWRNRLMSLAESHQTVPEVAVLPGATGLGSIRIVLEAPEHLSAVLAELSTPADDALEVPTPEALLTERIPDTFSLGAEASHLDWRTLRFSASPPPSSVENWELERRTYEAHQTAYVLLHGERRCFVSRSRRWSGFLAGLVGGTPLWCIDPRGVLTSIWPLPVPIARQALLNGGGVAGSSWQTSDRVWYYSFLSVEQARRILAPWLYSPPDEPREADGMKIWLSALAQVPGAPPEEVLDGWYRRT